MKDRPNVQLDVLVAIRHRQCGVLRWMVEQKIIDLDCDAKSARLSMSDFRFIENVPAMSLGSFLCFAAVEYDDLYSLQWLCETRGFTDDFINGMNLVHLSALFGRFEIVGWLHTSQNSLFGKQCTNKTFDGAYPVQIAAGQGHIYITELLLKLGCNEHDKDGRPSEEYAKKAPIVPSLNPANKNYKSVHNWAKDRAYDRTGEATFDTELAQSLSELLDLLKGQKSTDTLKKHIIRSKCLNIQSWVNSNFIYFDRTGPLLHHGKISYGDIVAKCLIFDDVHFAEWLIVYLKLFDYPRSDEFWKENNRRYTKVFELNQQLSRHLSVRAEESKQIDRFKELQYDLMNDVSISNPSKASIFTLISSYDNLELRLRSKLIFFRTLFAIVDSIKVYGISQVVMKGGKPDVLVVMARIYQDVRNTLETKDFFTPDLIERYDRIREIANTENLITISMESELPF
jgi:hypothetical protein